MELEIKAKPPHVELRSTNSILFFRKSESLLLALRYYMEIGVAKIKSIAKRFKSKTKTYTYLSNGIHYRLAPLHFPSQENYST